MHRHGTRHWPFKSTYLRDFEVIEERRNGVRLYPHTEQLPLLSKAINREFEYGLTSRLAKTDARADEWRKLCLWSVASSFSNFLSVARADHIHVQPFLTPERVARVALIQQVSRSTAGGLQHWFRYFHADQFLPDVHFLGKRPVFSTHAIERYAQRINVSNGHAVNFLLAELFNTVPVFLEISGPSLAIAFIAGDSMAAMPTEYTGDEIIFLTTLSPHEINHASRLEKRTRLHFHFGPAYPKPTVHNFDHGALTEQILQRWRAKAPRGDMRKLFEELQAFSLTRVVQIVDGSLRDQGFDERAKLAFVDDVYGPTVLTLKPLSPIPPAATPATPSSAPVTVTAAPAPRWPVSPPRGKAPGTASDDEQRTELWHAMTEFIRAMTDRVLRNDEPKFRVHIQRYRQAIERAAAQGVEKSLAWSLLAVCMNDPDERLHLYFRTLDCLRAERAAHTAPLTGQPKWGDLHTEAESLFEIGRVHADQGASALAREFFEKALPLAREADALAQQLQLPNAEKKLADRISKLLRQLPDNKPTQP